LFSSPRILTVYNRTLWTNSNSLEEFFRSL
jgi:hypothetical protein